jgi:hypothetical protein
VTLPRSKVRRAQRSRPKGSVGTTGFATGAAACGAQTEAVAGRSAPSGARADASGTYTRDL